MFAVLSSIRLSRHSVGMWYPGPVQEGSCTRDWEGFGELEDGSMLMISHVGMSAYSTAPWLLHAANNRP